MSDKLYVMVGGSSGELLTYRGRVITHGNRREMEYLFPGTRVIELPDNEMRGRPQMALRDHPDMSSVRWPLRREDFVHA